MKNQIFRKEVPKEFLFELLEKICLKTDKYYYVDYNSYKQFIHHHEKTNPQTLQELFVAKLRQYYYESKQHYLDRKMNYNSFVNIIRQICKNSHIPFSSKICYNKSTYNIDYYIFHTIPEPKTSPRTSPRCSPRTSTKTTE